MTGYYNKNGSGLTIEGQQLRVFPREGEERYEAQAFPICGGETPADSGEPPFSRGRASGGLSKGKRGRRKRKGQAEYKRITRSRGHAGGHEEGARHKENSY